MKRLPLQMKGRFSCAVNLISQNRMPGRGHVYPDLVGAPRLQTALNIGILPETLQHLIVGDSLLAVILVDCHPLSLLFVPADGRADSPLVLLDHAVHDGTVAAIQGMCLQLLTSG